MAEHTATVHEHTYNNHSYMHGCPRPLIHLYVVCANALHPLCSDKVQYSI